MADEPTPQGTAPNAPPAPVAQGQVQAPGQNPVFALTPATAIGGIIDYGTTQGRKLYAAATAKLSEDLYNCNAGDLYAFLKALRERAREYGWETPGVGIMSIPDDHINPMNFKSLIDNHGEIDINMIRTFEESYV